MPIYYSSGLRNDYEEEEDDNGGKLCRGAAAVHEAQVEKAVPSVRGGERERDR
jgi:hypothetical protein